MPGSDRRVPEALVGLILGLTSTLLAGGRAPPPAVQPRTHTSPSGRASFFVDPTDREGRGPAHYRIELDGKVLWQGEKPYTLYQAGVADDGTAGSYSYSHGIDAVRDHALLTWRALL